MNVVRRLSKSCSVLIFLLAGSASAEPSDAGAIDAEPAGGGDSVALARARYGEGVEAYRRGRYEQAIEAFIAADILIPSAALSFNVARAYEKLHDPANAVVWYRDYLRRSGFLADRSKIEERIATLEAVAARSAVQHLSVVSIPLGATLTLDGKPAGTTPWQGHLPTGAHYLELDLSGYGPVRRRVWLTPDAAVDVQLALPPAGVCRSDAARRPPRRITVAGPTAAAIPIHGPAPGAAADAEHDRATGHSPIRTWGYVVVGAGTAALASGAVFEVLRRRTESDTRSEENQVRYAEKYDKMEREQTASRALLGSGVALLIAGGTLIFAGSRRNDDAPRTTVSFGCLTTGCSASMLGRF